MADDNIFLNSVPVEDEQLYPREADGVLRTTVEDFDLENWNDTPIVDETKRCSCSKCQCSEPNELVQDNASSEDLTEQENTQESEFVDP